jgi:hypothetical protein
MLPLYEHLKDEYRFVIGHPLIANTARDMGAQIASLNEAINPQLLSQSQLRALWLQQNIQAELTTGELITLDSEYAGLSAPQLQQWFPSLTFELLIALISRLRGLEEVIKEHGIAGVLVHEDVTAEGRSLVAIGRKFNVPTMHIPHANHFLLPDTGDIHAETRAEFLGVAGNYMYNWYKTAGVDPKRMTIIGAPQWDSYYREAGRLDQPHARRCFGLDLDKPVWMYATTWAQATDAWGEGQEDLFAGTKWFLQTARDADVQVILKLHPHEANTHAQRYQKLAEDSGVHAVLTSHYLSHILAASDVVITQGSSNLAVEAGIMGKPVVELLQPGTKYPDKYGIPGSWGPDLKEAIDSAMGWGPSEEFLKDMNVGPGSLKRAEAWIRGVFNAYNKV